MATQSELGMVAQAYNASIWEEASANSGQLEKQSSWLRSPQGKSGEGADPKHPLSEESSEDGFTLARVGCFGS